jgi:hypothetical protein
MSTKKKWREINEKIEVKVESHDMLTCVTKIFTSLGIGSDDDSYHI